MEDLRTYTCLSKIARRFAVGALVACLAAAVLAVGGCSGEVPDGSDTSGPTTTETAAATAQEPQERSFFAFDTIVTLECYCSPELMDRVVERCGYFEQRLSRTLEGSDVWNINHAGGVPVEVAPETAGLISRSLEYCERSGGLLDITIGAVSGLWDFKEGIRPDDAAIAEAVKHVDYRKVHVDGNTVRLDDPAAAIDLGGTAKGYIADDLARMLREGGCESGLINLGGNVYALGKKPDGSDWNVGVQDPNGTTRQSIIAKLPCADTSVVTSGLYERQFTQDGTLYYHILDPRTGYPVETDLASSSVACPSSLDGDAYATWLFLLGHDKALELVESTPGMEALLVDADGVITMSSGAAFERL